MAVLGQVPLEVRDANDLVRALLTNACDAPGDRLLFVKGEPAAIQGLRRERHCADVDVLADRATVRKIAQHLEARGWRSRPLDLSDDIFPQHSTSYIHPQWPGDIDVHSVFPGFDAPQDDVVAALWSGHVTLTSAGVEVPVPGPVGHVAVVALNALRHPGTEPATSDLDHLVRVAQELVTGEEMLRFAEQTGSLAALRPFLERAFPGHAPSVWPRPSRVWLTYTITSRPAAIRAVALLDAPLRQWPHLLRRALAPSRAALSAVDLRALEDDRKGLIRRRWARLRRAIADAPATAREVHAYRALRRAEADRSSGPQMRRGRLLARRRPPKVNR